MPYRNELCEKYTSLEIQRWIETTEHQLRMITGHDPNDDRIQSFHEMLDNLHADLILKKHEERQEMKELLNRLLQMIELV